MSSPWSKKTVTQLKDELVRRNLEVTGKKADLVARLDVSDQELHSNGTETSAEATADCSMNEAADQAEEASALPENMEESTEESQEQNGADDCTEGEEGEENAEEKIEEEAHDQEEVLGNEVGMEEEEEEVDYDEMMVEDELLNEDLENDHEEDHDEVKDEGQQEEEEVKEQEESEEKVEEKAPDETAAEDEVPVVELHADDDSDGEDGEHESWKRQESKNRKEEAKAEPVVQEKVASKDDMGLYIFHFVDKNKCIAECLEFIRLRKVMVYPLSMADLSTPEILSCFENCIYFQIRFRSLLQESEEETAGWNWDGMVEMDFNSLSEAKKAEESLPKLSENFTVKRFRAKESDRTWPSAGKDEIKVGSVDHMLYVENLQDEVDDAKLREIFPNATMIAVPVNKEEKLKGYAYVQFNSMEKCLAALKAHEDGLKVSENCILTVKPVKARSEPFSEAYLMALYPEDPDHEKKIAVLSKLCTDIRKDIRMIQDQLHAKGASGVNRNKLRTTLRSFRNRMTSSEDLLDKYKKEVRQKKEALMKQEEEAKEAAANEKAAEEKPKTEEVTVKEEKPEEKKETKSDSKGHGSDKRSRDRSRDRSRKGSRDRKDRSRDRSRHRSRDRGRRESRDLRHRIRSRSRERHAGVRPGPRGLMGSPPRGGRGSRPMHPQSQQQQQQPGGMKAPGAQGLAQLISQVGSGGASVQDLMSFVQQQQQQQQMMQMQMQQQQQVQQRNIMMQASSILGGFQAAGGPQSLLSTDEIKEFRAYRSQGDDRRNVPRGDVFERLGAPPGRRDDQGPGPKGNIRGGRFRDRSMSPQRKRMRDANSRGEDSKMGSAGGPLSEPESKTVNLLVQLSDMLNSHVQQQQQGQYMKFGNAAGPGLGDAASSGVQQTPQGPRGGPGRPSPSRRGASPVRRGISPPTRGRSPPRGCQDMGPGRGPMGGMMGSMGKMQATPDFAQQREAAQRLGERMTAGMGGNYRSEGSYGGRGAMDKYPGVGGFGSHTDSFKKGSFGRSDYGSDQYEPDKPTEDNYGADAFVGRMGPAVTGSSAMGFSRGVTDFDARQQRPSMLGAGAMANRYRMAGATSMGSAVSGMGQGVLGDAPHNPRTVPRPFAPSRPMRGSFGGGY